jgi:hypothetical protein
MIHIERGRLPAGAHAVALREEDSIVLYVSEGLSARERTAAIRQALRAAPAAGWRSPRSPVLLPSLVLGAGLRRAPEGRWSYRMLAVSVAGVALLITATTVTTVSVQRGGVDQPTAAAPAAQPPLTSAGPTTSQSAPSRGSAASPQPGNGSGSSPTQPGSAPQPRKTTTTSAGGPAPQASGSPAPVPTSGSSPQPSQAPSPSPSPSASPTPAKQSGGSGGACVDLLGVTLCV